MNIFQMGFRKKSQRFIRIYLLLFVYIYACASFNRLFVCVEVLLPIQPNGVMLSAISLPKHTFTGQA